MVHDGILTTPPKSRHLLPGVTRDLVLELAWANGLPCREESIPETALRRADEIWLTSSTREVMAVTRLDGEAVGDGMPGPVWNQMHGWYQACKARLRSGSESC